MRILAALAVMLVWASTAAAALPPPGYHPAFVFQRTAVKSTTLKTCTAGAHTRKGKTQKRLVTTACEQPPKANVKDLGGTFWYSP
jgi:hypothetical protein